MSLPPRISLLAALFIGSLAILVSTFFASAGRGTLALQIFLLLLSGASATGLLIASYRQDASVEDWSVGDDVRCTWNVDGGVLVAPEPA